MAANHSKCLWRLRHNTAVSTAADTDSTGAATAANPAATGAGQPGVNGPATGNSTSGSGVGATGGAPNPTLDQGAAKAAPFGSYANPTPTDSVTSNVGLLGPLLDENRMVDSYVYKKLSTGTPPAGPQVSTAKGNLTITATDGAKHTNFGGVYGHTLTASELGSNDLGTITAADPTGLLVATPVEGDPNLLSVREYKGYQAVYS
jgi:hypothetical protein